MKFNNKQLIVKGGGAGRGQYISDSNFRDDGSHLVTMVALHMFPIK